MVASGNDRLVTCCTFVIFLSCLRRNIALHSHARSHLSSYKPACMSAPEALASHYGGDAAGLICGYLLREGSAPQAIDTAEAVRWLDSLPPEATDASGAPESADNTFAWLHFNLSHAQAVRWVERHSGLPHAFFETLNEGSHSTRIERDDDTLIAVLNDVHFDFDFEAKDFATLWIGVTPRLVITARTQALRSVDALRTAVREGDCPRSSVALLEQLMRTQADVLVGIVRGVTQRIDGIEDELLAGRLNYKRARLGQLRRLLVRLQRLLAPEPAALFRLLQRPPAWMAEADAQELRDASEEFSVVLRDMQGLQERIKLLQEEVAANVQEDNNRSLFVLTVVTVLALPINILTGLFGMNVGGVPMADAPHGFWVIVIVLVAFTAVAARLALRRGGD